MIDRRTFLATGAALLAGGCARAAGSAAGPTTGTTAGTAAQPAPGRLPIAFSTLGCPQWSWRQVLDFGVAHGYQALELRGLLGEMDLTKVPELAPARLADTKRELADRALRVACLGASANMHERDAARRAAHLDEARRFVDLAAALGAPYVRVFGDRWVAGEERAATLARVAAGLRAVGEHARGTGVTVLLESHGDFTAAPTLVALMRETDSPAVALLWDAHHTFASAGEAPEDTARQIMPWVRHTHLKDSRPAGAARRYVLTGEGDVPVRRQFEVLARHGYRGYYAFEWEKRWHPEIEEPEVALAHYARVAREYLAAAAPAR